MNRFILHPDQPLRRRAPQWLRAVSLGLCTAGWAIQASTALANTLRLKPTVTVTGDALLKDIAELEGAGLLAHADLPVAEFRGQGGEQTLQLQQLTHRLRQAGVPISGLRILGARSCTIRAQADVQNAPALIANAPAKPPEAPAHVPATAPANAPATLSVAPAAASAQANTPGPAAAISPLPAVYRVHDVVVDMIAQALNARPEELIVTAEGPGTQVMQQTAVDPRGYRMVWSGAHTPGTANILLQRLHAEAVVERLPIRVTIKQRVLALCPRNPHGLNAGNRLVERDLQTQPVWIDFDPQQLVTDVSECRGQLLSAALPAGQPLRQQHLPKPIAVRRGDTVELRHQVGELLISVPAKALGNAAIGERTAFDTIPHGRRRSRQSVYAVVVASNIALVQPLAAASNAPSRRPQ